VRPASTSRPRRLEKGRLREQPGRLLDAVQLEPLEHDVVGRDARATSSALVAAASGLGRRGRPRLPGTVAVALRSQRDSSDTVSMNSGCVQRGIDAVPHSLPPPLTIVPGAWISSAGQPTTATEPASSSRRLARASAAPVTPPAIGPWPQLCTGSVCPSERTAATAS
jgi:hypothetical protein